VPRDEAGLPDSRILQPQVLLPTSSPHEHDKGRTSDCLAGSDSDSETEPSLASQRRYIVAIQTHLGSLRLSCLLKCLNSRALTTMLA
jgi:hypothetical protein